jgi:hypothetical protein
VIPEVCEYIAPVVPPAAAFFPLRDDEGDEHGNVLSEEKAALRRDFKYSCVTEARLKPLKQPWSALTQRASFARMCCDELR